MRRNWNFIKFLIDNTIVFPTQLHSQDTEVCASKVQCIKKTFLIPIKIRMKVSNKLKTAIQQYKRSNKA